LDWPRVEQIVAQTKYLTPAAATAVEAKVIADAPRLNVPRLKDALRAAVADVDAETARARATRARKDRHVRIRPGDDGMGELLGLNRSSQHRVGGASIVARRGLRLGSSRPGPFGVCC